jgi:hypothetical protein
MVEGVVVFIDSCLVRSVVREANVMSRVNVTETGRESAKDLEVS